MCVPEIMIGSGHCGRDNVRVNLEVSPKEIEGQTSLARDMRLSVFRLARKRFLF